MLNIPRRRARLSGEERKLMGVFPVQHFDFGAQASRNLYGDGIRLKYDLPDLDAHGVACYNVPLEHSTRRERLMQRRAEENVRPEGGLHAATAALALLTVAVLLGGVWLVNRAAMTASGKHVSALQVSIDDIRSELTDLEEEYTTAAAGVDVGYEAVSLGMISTKGSARIYLHAPEDAVLGPMEYNGGVRTSQLAAITGD